jgi:hypothetical protein
MRYFVVVLILGSCSLLCEAQQPAKVQAPRRKSVTPATPPPLETQTIESPTAPPAPVSAQSDPGYMEPAQVKDLLHRVWLAEYRINDLLTQIHPERWKISEATRNSFKQNLETLQKTLAGEAEWRAQFEKRPDSMYLGYETYAAVGALLPRLEGLAHSVSQLENPSLGAQYSQTENQFFDLNQSLQPYLAFLMRNQDQVLFAAQNNLASCQNQLGSAMRGRAGRAKPIKNVFVEYKGRRPANRASEKGGSAKTGEEAQKEAGKNKKPDASNPPSPPAKPQQ